MGVVFLFTVLDIVEEDLSVVGRFFRRMRREEPELSKVAVRNGAPFFLLGMRAIRGEIPWDKILQKVGRCASRILAREDLILPERVPFRRFTPEYLPLCTAENTLCEILKLSEIRPQKISLGIHDPNGALRGRLSALVPYCSDLRIVTNKTNDFEEECRRILENSGAGITRTDDLSALRSCNLILCRDASLIPATDGFLFSAMPSPLPNCFYGCSLTLPQSEEALRPSFIDASLFAAALYELCGVRRLSTLSADFIRYRAMTLTPKDCADVLRHADTL